MPIPQLKVRDNSLGRCRPAPGTQPLADQPTAVEQGVPPTLGSTLGILSMKPAAGVRQPLGRRSGRGQERFHIGPGPVAGAPEQQPVLVEQGHGRQAEAALSAASRTSEKPLNVRPRRRGRGGRRLPPLCCRSGLERPTAPSRSRRDHSRHGIQAHLRGSPPSARSLRFPAGTFAMPAITVQPPGCRAGVK